MELIYYRKECSVCKEGLPIDNFYFITSKGRHMGMCKYCYAEKRKPASVKYIKNNLEKVRARTRRHNAAHREQKRLYSKEYHSKNRDKANLANKQAYERKREVNIQKRKEWYQKNKERHAIKRREYELNNKERLRAARRKWENERLVNDVSYRMGKNLSGRIRGELKGVAPKTLRTEELLGCSIDELKVFIEEQFTSEMNWGNWMVNGWHIDHRIPISWFDLSKEEEQKKAFNYKNLQPLWGTENIKKNNHYAHPLAK